MRRESTVARDAAKFGDFVRSRREEIIIDWAHMVRALPRARTLPRPALVDSVPDLLDRIAEMADALADGTVADLTPEAQAHGEARMREGFDLGEVIAEYTILRDCILRAFSRERPANLLTGLSLLNEAIDHAVAVSVDAFVGAHDRAREALALISSTAFEASDVDALLARLLRIIVDTVPTADVAAILVREDEELVVRTAVGLEAEVAARFRVPIGQGFAGTIAAQRAPLQLQTASASTLVKSEELISKGVLALYGTPLIESGQLLGVAYMGSTRALDFTEEDRQLFGVMASRAAAAIEHDLLVKRAVLARDRFLTIASHELRTPLTSLQLHVESLRHAYEEHSRGVLAPERIARKLVVIERQVNRLNHLIDDVLDSATR